MNSKLQQALTTFTSIVMFYIQNEYYPKYYRMCKKTNLHSNIRNIIYTYYLGGNNVPDTANAIVTYLKTVK
jgi:hypothetical protein